MVLPAEAHCQATNMSRPPHVPITVREDNCLQGAATIVRHVRPHWPQSELKLKVFTDGITNKLVGCYLDDEKSDMVLIRVYGQNTDLLIDREAETRNFKLLQERGYAPRLYATFNNGLAYEFVPGEVLNKTMVREVSVYPLVARMLARVHQVECPEVVKTPVLWQRVSHYLTLVPPAYSTPHKQALFRQLFPRGVAQLKEELDILQINLQREVCQVVFCHNDLLLANIIYSDKKVTFIDYEYAAYNYLPLDIGNHFTEFAGVSDVDYSLYPEKEFQVEWLRIYLEEYHQCQGDSGEVSEEEIEKLYRQVNKFSLASHFMWTAWALVQAHHSTIDFDFIRYGDKRMKEYYNRKDIFLSL